MGMEYVNEIDGQIKIQIAFVTATDKEGLVENIRNKGKENEHYMEGVPENGIIGALFDANPHAMVISTGGTAKLIDKAGLDVMEIGDFTGWPEMETGLVKSMQAKLYVGMLAHKYTKSDARYMLQHGTPSIDLVLANFYPFKGAVAKHYDIDEDSGAILGPKGENPLAFEIVRQNMDVGGPTAIHTARKGFLGTAVAVTPDDYAMFIKDLKEKDGCISLESRFKAMQNCSAVLADYHSAINKFMQGITVEDVRKSYPTIHGEGE